MAETEGGIQEESSFDEFFDRCFPSTEDRSWRHLAIVIWNGALGAAQAVVDAERHRYIAAFQYECAAAVRDAARAIDSVRKVQD